MNFAERREEINLRGKETGAAYKININQKRQCMVQFCKKIKLLLKVINKMHMEDRLCTTQERFKTT